MMNTPESNNTERSGGPTNRQDKRNDQIEMLRRQLTGDVFLQKNWSCALNTINQKLNGQRGLTYTFEESPVTADHQFIATCRWVNRGSSYLATAKGKNKKFARELVSYRILTLAFTDEEEMAVLRPMSAWIRDLVREGIEPNPGPPVYVSGVTFSGSNSGNIALGAAGPGEIRLLTFQAVSSGATFTDTMRLTYTGQGVDSFLLTVPHNGSISVWASPLITNVTITFSPAGINARYYFHSFRVHGSEMTVTDTGSITTVMNSPQDPIPVEVSTAKSIEVNVAQDSLPLWVTNFNTHSQEQQIVEPLDLTVCGDVEKNPGPGVESPVFFDPTDGINSSQQPKVIVYPEPQSKVVLQPEPIPTKPDREEKRRMRAQLAAEQAAKSQAYVPCEQDTVMPLMSAVHDVFKVPKEQPTRIYKATLPDSAYDVHNRDPEWTRQQLEDHILAKAKLSGKWGRYFKDLAAMLEIDPNNMYSTLTIFIDEPLVDEVTTEKPSQQSQKAPPEPRAITRKSRNYDDLTKLDSRKATPVLDKKAQFTAVVARIVKKLNEQPDQLYPWLKKTSTTTKFKRTVVDTWFGEGWENNESYHQYHVIAYCYFNNHTFELGAVFLMRLDFSYGAYSHLFDNHRADLEAAKLHNKLMHAFNGNVLSKNMEDVRTAPQWETFVASPQKTLPRFAGFEVQAVLSNVVGDENPNITNLFYQDRLRGNCVNDNGIIQPNCVIGLPSTNVFPTQMMHSTNAVHGIAEMGGAATRITEVNVAEYYSNPITPTELAMTVSDQIKNNQTSNWRRDNTKLAGYSNFDIASINTALSPKGLNLEQILLKLELLHSILSLEGPNSRIPASTWETLLPSWKATPTDATLDYNITSVGNDIHNTNPVFPFGGDKGSVAFHLTIQSVPHSQRADVIFVPQAVLQSSEDAMQTLMLWLVAWTDFPFGLYYHKKECNWRSPDQPDKDNEQVTFMSNQTCTHVPGKKEIHFILPRNQSEANPTTAQAANAMAVVRPITGSEPAGVFAANTWLDVNYVRNDGVCVSYPITDLLSTWALDFDTTTIKQLMGRIAAATGIRRVLESVREMNVAMCQHIPLMILSNNSFIGNVTPNDLFLNSAELTKIFSRAYSNHTVVTIPPSRSPINYIPGFPVMNTNSSDFRIFETDPMVLNKVFLGLATAPNLTPEALHELPHHIGDSRSHYWERLEVLAQAATYAVFFASSGLTTSAWNQGYRSSENKYLQMLTRYLYSTTQLEGSIMPARLQGVLESIMETMFERSPCRVTTSVGGEERTISHFGRWLPGRQYAPQLLYTNNAYTAITAYMPTILPDIWVQYLARKLPMFAMSFPPPSGVDSTQGFGTKDNLEVHRNNNNTLIAPFLDSNLKSFYPITAGPNLNDKVKWNVRLWGTTPSLVIRNYAAQPLVDPAVETEPQFRPTQRTIQLNPGEGVPPGLLAQSTLFIPEMGYDGARIVPYLAIPLGGVNILACNAAARLARPAWLLEDVFYEPQLQALSSESHIFIRLAEKTQEDFAKAIAVKEIPAKAAETALQAIDVASLPSSNTPAVAMTQPTEPVQSQSSLD